LIPLDSAGQFLLRQYGLLSPIGLFRRFTLPGTTRAETLLVVVWGVAITLTTFTQIRFNYYLSVVVAALTVWVTERLLDLIELPSTPQYLEVYQVLSLLIAFVLVLAPPPPRRPPLSPQRCDARHRLRRRGRSDAPDGLRRWDTAAPPRIETHHVLTVAAFVLLNPFRISACARVETKALQIVFRRRLIADIVGGHVLNGVPDLAQGSLVSSEVEHCVEINGHLFTD
jgi:hypothetical protein